MAAVASAQISEVPVPDVPKEQVDIKTEKKASDETSLPFDPAALKEKYLAERDKRLARNQGVEQYTLLDGQLSHYLKDPWVEPGFERDPIHEETEVVIVGGGYGAQVVAVRLLEAGVDNFRIIEKAGGFGGTWYWNRYPGAQCDIESYIYMPLLEEVGYMPTEKYAHAKELLEHSHMIGEKFNLYSRALFQTEVKHMKWSEEEALWTTSTSRGDVIKSRFIIPAAGPLHRPKFPGLDGIQDFKGKSFHSSRWDFDYTGGDPLGNLHKLQDKRVGIIGTGATAVQIVPHLGEWSKQLYVFQRTPSSIDVRGNRPTDTEWAEGLTKGWQKKRMDNFDSVVSGGLEEEDMVADGWTDIIRELITRKVDVSNPVEAAAQRQLADFKKMEQIRKRCDDVVQDRATAEKLKPWYNQFCKRPCFHDEYLDTFNRPNVSLIDTAGQGVDRITEKGVVANGIEYELDCLIYATGFELANEWSHKTGMEIYGRNGQTITEKWRDGASTLHGWASRGFPNCMWVQVVQAALTPNFMHVTGEQARHFAYVIAQSKKRGIRTLEPSQKAEEDWCTTIVEGAKIRADFFRECTPGYYNNEGKPSLSAARNATYVHGSPAFLKLLREWRESDCLDGLNIQYFDTDTGGIGQQVQKSVPTLDHEKLLQLYADLQKRHQTEMIEVLSRQRKEVEKLLHGHGGERLQSFAGGVHC
ncbi:FAD/NAD(P)-binding domain-containing protein [Corynespora cassiicola Philippines]|uniref:FAD/NAD(P)-binding domain-containing protein n=1 Tax=Corynespora cassiicola Philippines TaxID=1448308 RepID=A0A2T2NRZ8_CORCC|nr:FAD/NAD(P)-binding domain-containing protein [Corynespora cassiicola Philippines]